MHLLLLLLFSIHGVFKSEGRCPPVEAITPCSCRTHFDRDLPYDILSCSGLRKGAEQQLREVLLRASEGFGLFELEVVDSDIGYLPSDAFINATFQILSVRNSSLVSLTDGAEDAFPAGSGLERSLRLLEVINCGRISQEWRSLRRLSALEEVHVSEANVRGGQLLDGLHALQHLDLDALLFQRNGIGALGVDAFAPFQTLERLALDNNRIEVVKRTMFPMPATDLKILGLGYNHLRELPADIFSDMPSLKSLYLNGNPLHSFEEAVFRPIWNQLHNVLVDGTRVSCDCSIAWIARSDNRGKFLHGECQRPLRFKGRMLLTIRPEELGCEHFPKEVLQLH